MCFYVYVCILFSHIDIWFFNCNLGINNTSGISSITYAIQPSSRTADLYLDPLGQSPAAGFNVLKIPLIQSTRTPRMLPHFLHMRDNAGMLRMNSIRRERLSCGEGHLPFSQPLMSHFVFRNFQHILLIFDFFMRSQKRKSFQKHVSRLKMKTRGKKISKIISEHFRVDLFSRTFTLRKP